jgi:uncharacterized protein (TIGR02145 family)
MKTKQLMIYSILFILITLLIVSCQKEKGELPTLSTNLPKEIAITSVLSGGSISSDGGAAITTKGVCWSLDVDPEISDSKTNDGSGNGKFNSRIEGLSGGTTYHIRAYATNSIGTSYGSDMSFMTYNSDAVSDKSGNYYNVVTIGKQTWMQEDLKYPADGIALAMDTKNSRRKYLFEGNLSENPALSIKNKYQLTDDNLFTWWEAMNGETSSNTVPSGVRGVCPDGYHLPSKAEWEIFKDYLINNGYGYGGSGNGIAKAMATKTGWRDTTIVGAPGNNKETNNTSGFSGFPGGYIDTDGTHYGVGKYCSWWSSTQLQPLYYSVSYGLYYYMMTFEPGGNNRDYRFYIRCAKD